MWKAGKGPGFGRMKKKRSTERFVQNSSIKSRVVRATRPALRGVPCPDRAGVRASIPRQASVAREMSVLWWRCTADSGAFHAQCRAVARAFQEHRVKFHGCRVARAK